MPESKKSINRGYWYDTMQRRKVFEKNPNTVWWDSALEHKTALQFEAMGLEYQRQTRVEIIPAIGNFPPKFWDCDFYLPRLVL